MAKRGERHKSREKSDESHSVRLHLMDLFLFWSRLREPKPRLGMGHGLLKNTSTKDMLLAKIMDYPTPKSQKQAKLSSIRSHPYLFSFTVNLMSYFPSSRDQFPPLMQGSGRQVIDRILAGATSVFSQSRSLWMRQSCYVVFSLKIHKCREGSTPI